MKEDRIAKLIANAICFFEGSRYHIHAWCVMPNHVHVVLTPATGNPLKDILHSWKSFTAKAVNKALGRTGQVWQEEYYDHLVRDEVDFYHQVDYVFANPARAGLKNWSRVGHSTGILPVNDVDHGQDAHAT